MRAWAGKRPPPLDRSICGLPVAAGSNPPAAGRSSQGMAHHPSVPALCVTPDVSTWSGHPPIPLDSCPDCRKGLCRKDHPPDRNFYPHNWREAKQERKPAKAMGKFSYRKDVLTPEFGEDCKGQQINIQESLACGTAKSGLVVCRAALPPCRARSAGSALVRSSSMRDCLRFI